MCVASKRESEQYSHCSVAILPVRCLSHLASPKSGLDDVDDDKDDGEDAAAHVETSARRRHCSSSSSSSPSASVLSITSHSQSKQLWEKQAIDARQRISRKLARVERERETVRVHELKTEPFPHQLACDVYFVSSNGDGECSARVRSSSSSSEEEKTTTKKKEEAEEEEEEERGQDEEEAVQRDRVNFGEDDKLVAKKTGRHKPGLERRVGRRWARSATAQKVP